MTVSCNILNRYYDYKKMSDIFKRTKKLEGINEYRYQCITIIHNVRLGVNYRKVLFEH